MKTFLKLLFLAAMLFLGIQDNWAATNLPSQEESAVCADLPDGFAVAVQAPAQTPIPASFDIPPNYGETMQSKQAIKENRHARRFQGPQNWRSYQSTNTVTYNIGASNVPRRTHNGGPLVSR